MTQDSFVPQLKSHFHQMADQAFSWLKPHEEMALGLTAESTDFVRFNQAKVRQSTAVQQITIEMTFQANSRRVVLAASLGGSEAQDKDTLAALLSRARAETEAIPPDPHLAALTNFGQSESDFPGSIPRSEQALDLILQSAQGQDLAGLFTSGPVVRAYRNSRDCSHWFSTDSFFVDYSLYTVNSEGENKAVKGNYAGRHFAEPEFQRQLKNKQQELQLLKRPNFKLAPGSYRTFLASSAVAEICQMFSWEALSHSAYKKGTSALGDLIEGKRKLSPLFSLKENFQLGLVPRFSETGESAPATLDLIDKGTLVNTLVNVKSAQEFGLASNGADFAEKPRSPEISGGDLPEDQALKKLGSGLYLNNLHYLNWSDLNQARITGMTRYACFWVENGEIVGPIKDLRFDESLYQCLGENLEAVTKEQHIDPVVETYVQRQIGGKKLPGLLISNFTFTL